MHRLGVVLAIACCAVAAGCGGGGGDSKAKSPADFRAEVTKLCTDVDAKINAIDQPQSDKDLSSYLSNVRKVAGPYVDKLDGLNPPQQLAADFDAIVSLNRQSLALVDRAKKLVDDGKTQQAGQLITQTGDRISSQERAKWRSLGVPKCAR